MVYGYLQQCGAIGAKHAIPMRELVRLMKTDKTSLKTTIQNERRRGALICSGSRGYYIAKDRLEIAQFRDSLRREGISRLETAKVFDEALRKQEGQINLFEVD